MEPRYFWARGFAFVFDFLIIGAVFGVFAIFAHFFISKSIVPPDIISYSRCGGAQLVSEQRINELLPLRDGEKHAQKVCNHYPMFLTKFSIGTLTRYKKEDGATTSTSISYFVDENGNETTLFITDPFLEVLAPFMLATWAFVFGVTPGKLPFRLRVSTQDGGKAKFRELVTRECGRFLPIMLIGLYAFASGSWHDQPTLDESAKLLAQGFEANDGDAGSWIRSAVWQIFLPGTAVFVAVVWYFFGSFIRWRGQTYWDRLAGTKVTKLPASG